MSARDKQPQYVCEGFHVGKYCVPAFQIHRGEIVRLDVPNTHALPFEELRRTLGDQVSQGSVHAVGKVALIDWIVPRSAFLELFHRQRAIEWFCLQTHLPAADARAWIERVGLEPDVPIAHLAGGTPRRLLAIQAALAKGADVIIFDTAGLDPMGLRRAWSALSEQIGESAAVWITAFDDLLPGASFAAVYKVTEGYPQPVAT
jgi:hypothetical protein